VKQLYVGTITTTIVIVAENEDDARDVANNSIREVDDDDFSVEMEVMRSVPAGWDKAIPYGERERTDPDRTVKRWIELGAAPELRSTKGSTSA
jgi:hypothetical protein